MGTPLRRSSVTILTEESGHKLPPDMPLHQQLPLPVAGSADRDQPERRRDLERVAASRATVDESKASHGAEKNGRRSVHDRVPTLERGNDQKRRVRAAHYTGPGGGPGDAVPMFAVRFEVDKSGASVAGIGPGPAGGVGAHGCCGFGSPHFFRKTGKKSGNFSFFPVIPVY